MKNKRRILLAIIGFLAFLVLIVNLGGFKQYIILGSWQGANVSENGNTVTTDWSKVKFKFGLDGAYTYINQSEYSEQGKYKIENNMLITTPQNIDEGEKRSVEIIQLRINSLILRMNDSGNEIILQLKRS